MNATNPLWHSTFAVPRMDCPSEEAMVRNALADLPGGAALRFDLPGRRLSAVHAAAAQDVLGRLVPLGLGAELAESRAASAEEAVQLAAARVPNAAADAAEARTLKILLAINAAMFVLEIGVGLAAQSAGLVADSLDMFADAAVYGMALHAVGRATASKARAARLAGWLQAVLALGALAEVVRRWWHGGEPVSLLMMGMGLVALAANVACLRLAARHREAGVHMKASYIFSANDVIANLGVIAAGALVAATGSPWPDLIVGTVIGLVVLNGARRILGLKG